MGIVSSIQGSFSTFDNQHNPTHQQAKEKKITWLYQLM